MTEAAVAAGQLVRRMSLTMTDYQQPARPQPGRTLMVFATWDEALKGTPDGWKFRRVGNAFIARPVPKPSPGVSACVAPPVLSVDERLERALRRVGEERLSAAVAKRDTLIVELAEEKAKVAHLQREAEAAQRILTTPWYRLPLPPQRREVSWILSEENRAWEVNP